MLFVDYIAEHLSVNGRAGVIVPEGIIFQSQNSYMSLRKMLVENYLWCVVSLPAGVFNPYSGVKISILLMDKALAKHRDEILFVKVENDGLGLGAQRRAIAKNDLPDAENAIYAWKFDREAFKSHLASGVSRKLILESLNCSLSGDRYKAGGLRESTNWPTVKLADILLEKPQYGSGAAKATFDGKVRYVRITDIDDDGYLKDTGVVSPRWLRQTACWKRTIC